MRPKSFRLHGVLASISGLTLVFILALTTLPIEAQSQQPRSLSTEGVETGAPVVKFNGMNLSGEQSSDAKSEAEIQAQTQSLFEQGLQEFQKHEYGSALKSFNNVLALDGSHKGALKYQKIVQKKLTEERSVESAAKEADAQAAGEPEKQERQQVDPNEIKGEAAYQEGINYYKNRDYQQAIESFTRCLELIPDHSKSAKYLERSQRYLADQREQEARLAQRQKELEAERQARAAAEQLAAEIDALMEKGRGSLASEDYAAAHDTFALVLEKDPENRRARSYLEKTNSLALEAQQEQQEKWLAEERAKQELALKQKEDEERARQEAFEAEIDALLDEGNQLLSSGQYEDAKSVLAKVLEKDAENRKATSYIAKADKLIEKAREDAERQRLEQERRLALAKEKEEQERLEQERLAAEAREREEQEQAEQARLARLAKQQALEDESEALLDEGKKALKNDEYEIAKGLFAQVLEKDSENRKALSYLEKTETESQKAAERAERERLEQERRKLEDEIDGYLYAGRCSMKEDDYDTAKKYLQAVLDRDAENPKALAYLEDIRQAEQERREELARAETEAEEQAEEEALAKIVEAGDGLLDSQNFDAAIEKYTEALETAPEDKDLQDLVAKAEREKASYLEEQERLAAQAQAEKREQDLREKQDSVDALVDAGRDRIKADEYDAAIERFREALDILPDDSSAQSWLAKAEKLQEEYQQEQYERQVAERERQEKLLARQSEEQRQAELAEKFDFARDLYRQGDYAKAKEGFVGVLQMDPENKEARRYLERSKAEEENQRILLAAREEESQREAEEQQKKQEQIQQAYADGLNAFNEGQYESAQSCFQSVLARDEDHAGASRYLAKTQAAIEESKAKPEEVAVDIAASAQPVLVAAAQDTLAEDTEVVTPAETIIVEKTEQPTTAAEESVLSAVSEQPTEPEIAEPVVEVTPEVAVDIADVDESVLPEESRQQRLEQHILLGKTYLEAKLYNEAKREIDAAKQLEPENAQVQVLSEQVETALNIIREKEALAVSEQVSEERKQKQARAAELVEQGRLLYEQGEIISAVSRFQDALELDPYNTAAANFYNMTRDEHAAALENATVRREQAEKEAEYEKMMNNVIQGMSLTDASIDEVVGYLGTISGFNFVAGEGVEGNVTVHIKEKTVKDALDLILKPYGFVYQREGKDIIIKPNFTTRIFQLTGDEYRKLEKVLNDPESLKDPSQSLQEILYPGLGSVNVPGRALYLNPKTLQLIVTDTAENISKVEEFLKNIPELTETAEPLITRLFPLNPEMANQMFKIIELMLYEGQKPQETPSKEDTRQLLLEKDTSVLIVKDTEENIQKVIELLNDEAIQQRVLEEELVARRFRVSPETAYTEDALIRKQREVSSIEELLKNMLYSTSREEAIRKGRRMYPNYEEGTIDIVDTPENIKKVERFLASTKGDEQDMRIFPVRHADVQELTNRLNLFAGRRVRGGQGDDNYQDYDDSDRQTRIPARIIPIPEAHSIVIRANAPALDMFATMVEMLDVEPELVEIETRLVEVSLQESQSFGIDWSLTNVGEEGLHVGRHDGAEVSQLDINVLNAVSGDGLNIAFDILGETELNTVLNILKKMESTSVLSAPKVVTLTSSSANLDFTTTQPYVAEIEQDTRGTDTPADDTLRYIYEEAEIGITMDVNPVVSGDGSIIMDINPSVSAITGFVPTGAGLGLDGADRPIIDTRTTSTRVRIRDGETIVIGGLISDQILSGEERVPFFSTIPIIGRAFRQDNQDDSKTNLIIFVTARLLKSE